MDKKQLMEIKQWVLAGHLLLQAACPPIQVSQLPPPARRFTTPQHGVRGFPNPLALRAPLAERVASLWLHPRELVQHGFAASEHVVQPIGPEAQNDPISSSSGGFGRDTQQPRGS